LRDEYGYSGGITQVREAVAQAKAYSKEVFVPLSHPVGAENLIQVVNLDFRWRAVPGDD
jgi:hypothetical protein